MTRETMVGHSDQPKGHTPDDETANSDAILGDNLKQLEDSSSCSSEETDRVEVYCRPAVKAVFKVAEYFKSNSGGEWNHWDTSCGETKSELFSVDDEYWNDAPLTSVQRTINWFIKTFTPIAAVKKGCVERADFIKVGQRNSGLGAHLFRLLDSDDNGRLGYEELIGGLKKLICRDSQRQNLKWFEHFVHQKAAAKKQDIEVGDFITWAKNDEFLKRFFDMTDIQGTGRPSMQQFLGSLDKLTCMEKDAKWLVWAEQRFAQVAGEDRLIYLEEFKKALNVKRSFFAERFFELIDTDGSGNISLSELMEALRVLVHGTAADKLKFLFQVYDVDGNGTIDYDELRTVLKSCTAESALQLSEETLNELTQVLFKEADTDCSGNICFEELRVQLEKYPDIADNLTISASEWLRPPISKRKYQTISRNCCSFSVKNIRNNVDLIIFMTLYTVAHVVLSIRGAVWAYGLYPDSPWVMVARASGRCLSFNCTFILILMLKKCLTALRSTRLASYLPIDQHVDLHKFVGYVIVLLSVIHAAGHTANYAEWGHSNGTSHDVIDYLFTTTPGIGWVLGTSSVTGHALCLLLSIVVLCSAPCIRRKGYFQVFYWTHQLSFLFWILLLFHSRTFWMWMLLPGVIYITERILRLKLVQRARHGRTYIKTAVVLPANVTHLVIPRQDTFHFQAGEYVYINIPQIARHEWHPFTISSAPEQQDFITIHIRAIGNWTKRLYEFFKERRDDYNSHIDSPSDTFQATNHFHKTEALESLAEEGAIMQNEGPREISVTSKSTYIDLETERPLQELQLIEKRKLSFGSTHSPDLNIPGIIRKADDNRSRMEDKSFDSINESAAKQLINTWTYLSPSEQGDEQHNNESHSKLPRVLKGSRLRPQPLSETPGQGNSIPLAASRESLISKQTTKRAETSNRISVICVSQEHTTKALAFNHNAIMVPPQIARNESLKVLKTSRTVLPCGKKILGRQSTQHSLNINNIQEFGSADTGVEVYIDGPYGAPSQHIFEAEHAVLIGAGIGITPFASILQSIHMKYKAARNTCPECSHTWMGEVPAFLQLRKVDFFWINRHQRSFEWFISLLNQIEVEQEEMAPSKRFITMRLYMTSALGKNDMKAIGLHMALDLIHQKHQRDMITGLMTKTEAGRPDWNEVFKQLEQQKKGKVTVFFCGSPHLGNVINEKCLEHGFDFRKENF